MTSGEDSDHAARAQFIAMVRSEFAVRHAQYRGAALARAGRTLGVLGASEWRALDVTNRLPDWVLNGLRPGPVADETNIAAHFVMPGTETVQCVAPVLGPNTITPAFFRAGVFEAPPIAVYEVANAEYYAHNFVKVVARSNCVLHQLSDPGGAQLWPVVSPANAVHLPGKTLVLIVEGSALLSHWLFDTIPRIKVAALAGHPLSSFQHVLLAAAHTNYHKETLRRLGLPPERVVSRAVMGVRYTLDEAVFVTEPRKNFIGGAWIYEHARELFQGDNRMSGPERIFLSRSRASRRRVTNEQELLQIAEDKGYRILHAEDYSVGDFASLIANARFFVGPHGAGHANIAFMARSNCAVAELFGAHVSREYWCMSGGLGFRHFLLEEDDISDNNARKIRESMPFMERNGLDFHVCPKRFSTLLRIMEEV